LLKLAREAHLLEITSLKSTSPKDVCKTAKRERERENVTNLNEQIQISAQGWFICGETEEADHILYTSLSPFPTHSHAHPHFTPQSLPR
jgi:hypothetical protein